MFPIWIKQRAKLRQDFAILVKVALKFAIKKIIILTLHHPTIHYMAGIDLTILYSNLCSWETIPLTQAAEANTLHFWLQDIFFWGGVFKFIYIHTVGLNSVAKVLTLN
jgi:hypothetical protein